MNINKVIIENFKCFEGQFELSLNEGVNILVGDNEVGKSTVIEAIHLALSGWLGGRHIRTELTQALFNNMVVDNYLGALKEGAPTPPPYILIELFLSIKDEVQRAVFTGNRNSTKQSACGVCFRIFFNEKYLEEYESLLKCGDEINSLPIEYYDFSWQSFAREERTPKTIPLKSALIDSTNVRYKTGSDIYISRLIQDFLSEEHKVKISQAHRKMKDDFMKNETVCEVNKHINEDSASEKKVSLSVDVSTKTAWETSLITCLDEIPFQHVGRGEQCLVKTKLALNHKKSKEANVILIEEPENHLTHSRLNKLIKHIKDSQNEKQIIISTHSSFVANKLGLGSLILLSRDHSSDKRGTTKIEDLKKDTKDYFEKLAGYDTLRLLLCKKAILVEGDSDELVVQKAYRVQHDGRLPIHDEIDVISAGTSFLRFLEIANKIGVTVAVVTDNDGDVDALKRKYSDYLGDNEKQTIKICFDEVEDTGDLRIGKNKRKFNYNTLEPKMLKENGLAAVNAILETDYDDIDALHKYMKANKTECALKIFDTEKETKFPNYILNAIEQSNE